MNGFSAVNMRRAAIAATGLGTLLPWGMAGPFSVSGIQTADGGSIAGMAVLGLLLTFASGLRAAVFSTLLPVGAVAFAVVDLVNLNKLDPNSIITVQAGPGLYVALISAAIWAAQQAVWCFTPQESAAVQYIDRIRAQAEVKDLAEDNPDLFGDLTVAEYLKMKRSGELDDLIIAWADVNATRDAA